GEPVTARPSQSTDPPNPFVSVTVTELPPPTLVALTASDGPALIVNVSEAEVPPPGDGVNTLTSAEPVDARSVTEIVACSCEELTNVVGRALPFHCTTDEDVKLLPFTVSVIGPPPENALVGESEL